MPRDSIAPRVSVISTELQVELISLSLSLSAQVQSGRDALHCIYSPTSLPLSSAMQAKEGEKKAVEARNDEMVSESEFLGVDSTVLYCTVLYCVGGGGDGYGGGRWAVGGGGDG